MATSIPAETQATNCNPLLAALGPVQARVDTMRAEARDFFYQVMLSQHACPDCHGSLIMAGDSLATCQSCGQTLDPTLAFQASPCCAAQLVRRPAHYACSGCGQTVPSRLMFDERVFDSDYFAQAMQAYRERAQKKRAQLIHHLAEARSEHLLITEAPDLGSVPGLWDALDGFIQAPAAALENVQWNNGEAFRLELCRDQIKAQLAWSPQLLSSLVPLSTDNRRDRAWRFITLLFMEQDGEVCLTQAGPRDLLIQREVVSPSN